MHDFHDKNDVFPAHASYDEQGKPLLSWRVHILPYLGHDDLFAEFRLDEPWDSPHNRPLIAKMPDVFKSPGSKLRDGDTCYVVPVSIDKKRQTIFSIDQNTAKQAGRSCRGISVGEIRDGTVNTMLIVEVAPQKACTWTQPDDWQFDPQRPRDGLFGMRDECALAALADATVIRIWADWNDDMLRRLVGRDNDGPPLVP